MRAGGAGPDVVVQAAQPLFGLLAGCEVVVFDLFAEPHKIDAAGRARAATVPSIVGQEIHPRCRPAGHPDARSAPASGRCGSCGGGLPWPRL